MEVDYQRPNDITCVADIKKQRNCIAEDQIYIFLTGLDHSLDQVRGHFWLPLFYQV